MRAGLSRSEPRGRVKTQSRLSSRLQLPSTWPTSNDPSKTPGEFTWVRVHSSPSLTSRCLLQHNVAWLTGEANESRNIYNEADVIVIIIGGSPEPHSPPPPLPLTPRSLSNKSGRVGYE